MDCYGNVEARRQWTSKGNTGDDTVQRYSPSSININPHVLTLLKKGSLKQQC